MADLETYAACPARYRFEHVDGLAPAARPDASERAQAAALSAMRELDGLGEEGPPSIDEVDSIFRLAWDEAGLPVDSGDAGLRDSARLFVERMAGVPADEAHAFRASPIWRIAIKGATVVIVPGRVVVHPYEKAVVQILATRDGRAGPIAWRAALTLIAARGALPGMRVRAEALDFDRAERFDIEAADEHAAIDRYGAIIDGIDRGDFHPIRSPQACSACPFFVACGR